LRKCGGDEKQKEREGGGGWLVVVVVELREILRRETGGKRTGTEGEYRFMVGFSGGLAKERLSFMGSESFWQEAGGAREVRSRYNCNFYKAEEKEKEQEAPGNWAREGTWQGRDG